MIQSKAFILYLRNDMSTRVTARDLHNISIQRKKLPARTRAWLSVMRLSVTGWRWREQTTLVVTGSTNWSGTGDLAGAPSRPIYKHVSKRRYIFRSQNGGAGQLDQTGKKHFPSSPAAVSRKWLKKVSTEYTESDLDFYLNLLYTDSKLICR